MPADLFPTSAELLRVLPEIVLMVAGTLLMALEGALGEGRKSWVGRLALLALAAALWAAVVAYTDPGPAFRGLLVVDGFATFFRALVIVAGILVTLTSFGYLEREGAVCGEFYALLLFSVLGQSLMVASGELIILFLGLEISSISSYVLAGFLRDDKRNNESALKYFLLGSFATAFLLYGVAWIYGIAGTTELTGIRLALNSPGLGVSRTLAAVAAALVFVGLAFKVSAAPFQVWTPDVYQGAPAPVSAFLSAGPKAAAFAVFVRVFMTAFEPLSRRWEPLMWLTALATMVIGNFAALAQNNLKRLLAYSSIAHAGYVLVALSARSEVGTAAVMFYLAAYVFMNVGAFAVISHFARKGERYVEVGDLAGLAARQPVTAGLLTVFLLSLIGVPATAGFFGKFYVFKAALDARLYWLTILGLLNSAVAAYYYLRIIVVMYMHEPGEAADTAPPLPLSMQAVLWCSALVTIALGLFPNAVLAFAGHSAGLMR